MSDADKRLSALELPQIAVATAVVIGVGALAILLYRLIDIFFIFFVGIVIAAALQPWHAKLCGWGVPKGIAVLLIYVAFLIGLTSIVLIVGPVLMDQITSVATDLPKTYSGLRSSLESSAFAPLRLLGHRLPPFERLTRTVTNASPDLFQRLVGVTASVAEVLLYVVTLLAIAFYWTMEVARLERLLLSLIPVERRVRALNIWHEIESKLGGFVRGQGIAMLAIGVASGIGYVLIGLPNALALAVLAGVLEAVPLFGPVLAAVPAVLVALPFGLHTALLVVALAVILQLTENYVLIPRIMHQVVGVSALVNLFSVLALGLLYGVAGVLVAIPMAATIQVVLESLVMEAHPVEANQRLAGAPWATLRRRVELLRQRVRTSLRSRESRMGIDPGQADHVVDAVDQQIEHAVARVEEAISAAEAVWGQMQEAERAATLKALEGATEDIEHAVQHLAPILADAKNGVGDRLNSDLLLDELSRATGRIGQVVERVEAAIEATAVSEKESREG
jgi:predicted PurR-regulated permease PerM